MNTLMMKVEMAFKAIRNLFYGLPTNNQLAGLSDKALMDQITYDAEDGRINTPYSAEYARRQQARKK